MSKKVIFFDNTEKHSCPFYSYHDDISSADFCMFPTVMDEIEENYCEEKCPIADCTVCKKGCNVSDCQNRRRTSCASPEEGAQKNTMEICHTAPNSAMLQGLKPHAGNTGTSA